MPKSLLIHTKQGKERVYVVEFEPMDPSVGIFTEGWICTTVKYKDSYDLSWADDQNLRFVDLGGIVTDAFGTEIGESAAVRKFYLRRELEYDA